MIFQNMQLRIWLSQFYQLSNDHSQNLYDNSADFIDNTKHSINNKLQNHFNPTKSTNIKETDQLDFDLQTYKKFISFLKFQEMMDKYNT